MRKTRSTSRVPLQTVTTQNSEKVKKDTGRRWQAAVKQEVAKLGTGFTDLKGKPEKPEVSPIKGKPELIKAVDPRPHHPGHPLDPKNGVRVKRESSTARVQPPGKRVKMEERSEEELSSDSEEELDYDQRRERNMRDNEAFFSSLGIEQAKQDLRLSAQKVPKPAVRRAQPKPKVVLPTRKSLRLQRIDVTGLPLPPQPEPEPFVDEHMEAFGVAGGLLQEFQGELLSSVCSVLQFHPSHNMLVGGNSSGYIFPFM